MVTDETDTQEVAQYADILRIYADVPECTDTLIESRYYNHLVLNAFKESLPLKANVRMLTRKLSKEALNSLVYDKKVS